LAREAEARERQERDAEQLRREHEAAAREAAAREAAAREDAYHVERERHEQGERDIELERRESNRRSKREDSEHDSWVKPVAAGVAGVAAAAAIEALTESRDERKDKKRAEDIPVESRYEAYREEEPSRSARVVESKVVEPKAVAPVLREVKPIIDSKVEVDDFDDDVIFDPNYFKKAKDKRRAAAEIALAGKAADKVIADMQAHYNAGPVDNESFWAPAELKDHNQDHNQDHKLNDPNADADVEVWHTGDTTLRGPPYERPYRFTAARDVDSNRGGLWSIPQLKVIEPTPPGTRTNSIAGSVAGSARGSAPASPVIEPQKSDEPVGEELERTRSGSRVRWGEDQTFHYEATTPESIREKYVTDDDVSPQPLQGHDEAVEEKNRDAGSTTTGYKSAAAATAAAMGITKELVESPVEEIPHVSPVTGSPIEANEPVYESHSSEITPVVVEPDERRRNGGFHQTPVSYIVSDPGTRAGLDEDEGMLPREHGFVEGEVFDPTPKEEKNLPSDMPGGFIEDEEPSSSSEKVKSRGPERPYNTLSQSKADAPSSYPAATGIVEAHERNIEAVEKASEDDSISEKSKRKKTSKSSEAQE
jgi:hypothetical protein